MDNTIIDDTFRTIVEKMPDLYADLVKLVSKIAAYIFREEDKVEKGADGIMGGKVLLLGSERLRDNGGGCPCSMIF